MNSQSQSMSRVLAPRELDPAEVDAVSGAATHKAFELNVAGMHIVGAYSDNGSSASWLKSGDDLYINGRKV